MRNDLCIIQGKKKKLEFVDELWAILWIEQIPNQIVFFVSSLSE